MLISMHCNRGIVRVRTTCVFFVLVHSICAHTDVGTITIFLVRLDVDWVMLSSLALDLRTLLELGWRGHVKTNVLLLITLGS